MCTAQHLVAAVGTAPLIMRHRLTTNRSADISRPSNPDGLVTQLPLSARNGHADHVARLSALGGGLNRSTQHFILEGKDGVCVMGQRFHRGFTAAEKTELWDRWKRGESLKAIGRAFGKPSSSIYFLVAPHGGIRPARAASFQAGIDARGARGDFQRDYGTSIGAIDGQVAWPLTLDGEPGNEPQWRL